MIQKVAAKGINTAKNVLQYKKNNNKITNVLEKEVNTVKNNIQFPKLKRFLEEAKNTIKAIISKIKGNKELKKASKNSIAKEHPSDPPRIDKLLKIIKNPEKYDAIVVRTAEELYRDAIESTDPTTKNIGMRVCSRIDRFNPTPKNSHGLLDNIDTKNNLEKHLSNEDGIHIRDKFTDWQHGKNIDDMPQIIEETNTNIHGIEFKSGDINSIQGHQVNDVQHHTESSLLDAIEKNHNKRNQLEQYADEVSGHSHSEEVENIDEIPDSFFD